MDNIDHQIVELGVYGFMIGGGIMAGIIAAWEYYKEHKAKPHIYDWVKEGDFE